FIRSVFSIYDITFYLTLLLDSAQIFSPSVAIPSPNQNTAVWLRAAVSHSPAGSESIHDTSLIHKRSA
ncbi:MAG TPA: hypothetical protein H9671_03135, partial [Firmicutes bacterium]|nr:hypothetical protein [Bacillota bacterium]